MKLKLFLILLMFIAVLAACASPSKENSAKKGEYFEKIPVIDGYYEGDKVWFIHPDVSNAEVSEKLTRMISYKTLYVPRHNDALDIEKLSRLYVFTNGISQEDVEPWGGGPFGYQIDVFDSIPGQASYTSLRRIYAVTWNQDSNPRMLKSEKEVLAAESAGELEIEPADYAVNVPMVNWPGGSTRLR